VAGYVIALAGKIPEPGEKVTADDGTVIEVLESNPRRIRLVRVIRAPKAVAEGSAS
jgi:putative hemolysin